MRKLTKEMKTARYERFEPMYKYMVNVMCDGKVVYTKRVFSENPDRALVNFRIPWYVVFFDDIKVEEI